ncbi:hypothetical protein D9619_006359 [Psilocybe cf. subviscida]|uniref:Uncharacterized protein n=1 Tax=Psilocybe cf. subviscida TaxID=2480587 RepID=A0A8H5B3J0_9AGAR|nr:hypothetical protein D9619_006359 [Psilocybe cf. subviscida]
MSRNKVFASISVSTRACQSRCLRKRLNARKLGLAFITLAEQGLIVNVFYLRPKMRPTLSRLIRVVPRSTLVVPDTKIYNRPKPQSEERKQATLIDNIIAQREAAGENWPQNIRLEPQLKKDDFKAVMPKIRTELKKLMKER